MKKLLLLLGVIFVLLLAYPKFVASNLAPSTPATPCRVFFNNDGYFFDTYEKVEYQNGLLVLHLKLKPNYSDGRTWLGKIFLHKDDCTTQQLAMPIKGTNVNSKEQFFSLRFSSPTHYDIWDDEQDVMLTCPACSVDVAAAMSDGSPYSTISYSGEIDGGASFMHSGSYSITEQKTAVKSPIIIVPGLLGTELNLLDQNLWPNLQKIILDPTDNFMDGLEMDSSGKSKNTIIAGKVISKIDYPFGSFHYTDSLVQDLQKNGYEEDKNLFLFNYDWRLGAAGLSLQLDNTIQNALKVTGAEKADVIAHSFGGLIAKYALINNADLDTKIGRVIFIGVPNLGIPEAAKALIFGSNLDVPFLNSQEVFNLAQNMPSIYELLPGQEYFRVLPGWFDDITNPLLTKMLTYSQSKSVLQGLGKNNLLLEDSEGLHSPAFDNFDFSQKSYPVFNLVSCGRFTVKTINKMRAGSSLLDKILHRPKYQISTDTGDGTVLLQVATTIKGAHNLAFAGVKHNEMISSDIIRPTILQLLTTADPISLPPVSCDLNGHVISLSSDIDITFVDNTTHKTMKPGEEIPVEQVGEDNFVFVSDDQSKNYTINMQPKTNASVPEKFSFDVAEYKDSGNKVYHYNEISISKDNTYALDVHDNQTQFKITGTNGQITTAPPVADDGSAANDLVAPVSAVYSYPSNLPSVQNTLKLSAGDSGVVFLANDVGSGVEKIEYSIDGNDWQTVRSGTNIQLPLGAQQLAFFSVDKAGNYEEIKEVQISKTVVSDPGTEPAGSGSGTTLPTPTPTFTPTPTPSGLPDSEESGDVTDQGEVLGSSTTDASQSPVQVNINFPLGEVLKLIQQSGNSPGAQSVVFMPPSNSSDSLDFFQIILRLLRFSARLIFF